ncbi:retrovirus-related pol polyprotein from transposon TNT 1-94 [Tanacetum coccineum]
MANTRRVSLVLQLHELLQSVLGFRDIDLGFVEGIDSNKWYQELQESALDLFPKTIGGVEKTVALKTNVYKKADSVLLLCLDNKGLREVNKEDSAVGVLLKLETVYMTKSLANKLYLKKKLFTFYMHSSKKLSGHIDEFNKLIGDLANIDVDIDDKDQELMESLTLEDVLSTLNLRELKKRADANDDGDGLFVRERSNHQGSPEERLSKKEQEEIHWLCPRRIEEIFLEWIMNSGSSYHMTPKGDFLFDFKEFNGGTILLGDNRACTIRGTVEEKFDIFGHSESRGLYREVAELGEPSVGIQENESLVQVWHKRLGHISEVGLYELERRYVLGNKGLGKLEFCENCVLGKSTRNEAFCKFKEWKQLVENQTGTLQQNGLHEQRCLAIHSGLPDSFWAEVTMTTAYLINRSPSAALEKNTPMDLWLDDVKPKIIIIRDVVFNESLKYKDTLKGSSATDSGKEVEFEVELQGSRVEPTVDPHTGKKSGNEDEKQEKGLNTHNIDILCSVIIESREEDDMVAYAFTIAKEEDTHEPSTLQDAVNLSKKDEWVHAMEESWVLVKKNINMELIDQTLVRRWLVARWFTQRAGIDYNEVFSPDIRHTSIRVILSLTACKDYELEQPDVKMAFLHGNLEETIYVRQLPGFEEGTGNKEFAPGMYIYLFLYVDDMLIRLVKASLGSDMHQRTDLEKEFDYEGTGLQLGGYLGTADVGLVYGIDQGNHIDVDGFVDADYAKDPNKGRAEYMALTEAVKQSIWLKGLLIKLGVNQRPVVVNCDNQRAIYLSRNAMFHKRTKHINVGYHFFMEIVESKDIKAAKIYTEDNATGAFTKVVPCPKFKYCMEILGVGAN